MSGIFPPNTTWTIPCNVNTSNRSGSAGYPGFPGSFGVSVFANITSIRITSNSSGNISKIDGLLNTGSSWRGINPSGSFTYLRRINNSGTTITNSNGFVGTLPDTDLTSTISSSFFIQYQATSSRSIEGYSTNVTATTLNYNILLPNLSNNMIFVDTSTDAKVLLLGSPSLAVSGTLIYIKDKSANAASKNIVVCSGGSDTIDGLSSFTINNNSGCLTLYSTGTAWQVANYYPSTNQLNLTLFNTWSASPPANKTANAVINSINVFDQSKFSERNTYSSGNSHNHIRLPNQTTGVGSMCIIVYAGTKLNNPHLYVIANSGKLDGLTNTNANQYLLQADANDNGKSVGAVFIGDGTDWYIVGWYNASNWNWATNSNGSSANNDGGYWGIDDYQPNPPALIQQVPNNTNKYYFLPGLPSTTFAASPSLRFVISKCLNTTDVTNGRIGVTMSTYGYGQSIYNYFNPPVTPISTSKTTLVYTGSQTRMCLWLVSLKLGSNNYISTYPIIGYTPGA